MAHAVTHRQQQILDRAREEGKVRVEDLARGFEVTPQTIRKDLNELCDRGMLQRMHGGAVLASGVENLGYDERQVLAREEKEEIGRRCAGIIPDNCSLFINIGTTTEAVAKALSGHEGLMVITNNINVANYLRKNRELQVIIAGGTVRARDGGIVGAAAVDLIEQFKVDYAVIGTSAIDDEGTLYDYDYREVRVTQAIIANARHVILVADSMKFERTAPVRIGRISQTNTFVTDYLPSERVRQICEDAGISVLETAPRERDAGGALDAAIS